MLLRNLSLLLTLELLLQAQMAQMVQMAQTQQTQQTEQTEQTERPQCLPLPLLELRLRLRRAPQAPLLLPKIHRH